MKIPMWPKPKNKKQHPPVIWVYRDGREECNLQTQEGHDIYEQRKKQMYERQGHVCCLYGHVPSCPRIMHWPDVSFDHEVPRGHGGGSQDDRIEVKVKQPDGTVKVKWQNGAAHLSCNLAKGSRRINYNAAHNGEADWELIQKFTRSGKVLFRCPQCGCETPAPTKNHKCEERHEP